MLDDRKPHSYSYDEAASVLSHLGFALAPSGAGTSHRKWRYKKDDGTVVVIGLVDAGAGTMKAYLVRDMVSQLRDHGLVPPDVLE